ncbi:MAG: BamA/TamA family outer membrane protein [Candidatus Aegiribacteria sp.]|nr:BamA/TamA family outer membrane protein [Candidatus Aegiribacteria sp.]
MLTCIFPSTRSAQLCFIRILQLSNPWKGISIVLQSQYFNVKAFTALFLLLILPSAVYASFTEPVVDSIYVSGDYPVSEHKLLSGTGLETGASLLRITPIQVSDGIVVNLNNLGYLDAEVTVQWPMWDDEINIVRISVESGSRSILSGLVFNGAMIYSADSLATVYPGSPGEPITPDDTLSFRNSVLKLYNERGYIYSSIDIDLLSMSEADGHKGYRAVECNIDENMQAFLGSVSVTGLETIREKVITREILIQPGDSLNMELLRQSISNIYGLGLFQDVRFAYSPSENDSCIVDLDISISETRYRRVDLGTGYVSPSAVIGSVTWLHPNIMGNNQRLSIGIRILEFIGSREGQMIEPEIIYEEPWLFSSRWKWQLKLGYLYLFTPGIRQRSYSITSTFARDISEHLKFTIGYSLEYEKYNEWVDSSFTTSDWRTTSSITSTLIHDTRSPVLDPLRGHWMMGEGKLSGGFLGGSDYYRASSEARLFFPMNDDFILAGRLRLGCSFPYGDDTTIPPDERFFLGGGTTVRGYPFNSLGPKDGDGNPVGGRLEVLSNFELRVRVAGNLGVVLFTDAGGLWNSFEEVDLETAGFGTGIGLRYHTVFGPLRLDYGFAPTWRNSLKRGKIYIGIGHAF